MAAAPLAAGSQPTLLTYNSIRPLATATEIENFGSFLTERCGSLEASFTAIDTDKLGHLTSDSFSKGVYRLGYTLDPAPVFHALDNSKHGTVDLQRFIQTLTKKGGRSVGPELGSTAIQKILSGQFKAAPKPDPGALRTPLRANAVQDLDTKLERLEAELALVREWTQQQQTWRQETEARIDSQLSITGAHTAEQMDGLRAKLDLAMARQSDELDALRDLCNRGDPHMIRTLVDERIATCRAAEHSQAMVAAKAAANDTSKLTEYVKDQLGLLDSRVQSLVNDHASFRTHSEGLVADLRKSIKSPAASAGSPDSVRISVLQDGVGTEAKVVAQEAKEAVKAWRAESQQQIDRILERVSTLDLSLEATGRLMGEVSKMRVSEGSELRADMIQRTGSLSERLEAVSTRSIAAEARLQELAARLRDACSHEEVSEIVSKAVGSLSGRLARIAEVEGITVNTHHCVEAMQKTVAALEERMVELSSMHRSLVGDDVARSIRTTVLAEVQGKIHDELRHLGTLRASEGARSVNDGAGGSADAAAGSRETEEALAQALLQLEQDATRLDERVALLERQNTCTERCTIPIDKLNARVVETELGLQSIRPIAEGGVAVAKHTAARLGELEAKVVKLLAGDDADSRRRIEQIERSCSERLVAVECKLADFRGEARAQTSAMELVQDMLVERSKQDTRQQASSDAMRAKLQALISKVDGRCAEDGPSAKAELDPRQRLSLPTMHGVQDHHGIGDICSTTEQTPDTPAMSEGSLAPSFSVSERNPRSLHATELTRALAGHPSGSSRSRTFTPVGAASDRTISSKPSTPGHAASISFPAYPPHGPGSSRSMSQEHHKTNSSKPSTPGSAGSMACPAYRPHGPGSRRSVSEEPHDGEQRSTLARTAKVLQGLREENLRLREVNVEMRESVFEGMLGGSRAQLEAVLEAAEQQTVGPQAALVKVVPAAGPGVDIAPMAKLVACKSPGAGPCHLGGDRRARSSAPPPASRCTSESGTQQRTQLISGSSKTARPSIGPAKTARLTSGTPSRPYSVEGYASPASALSEPAVVPSTLQAPRSSIVYTARNPVPMR